MPALPPVARGLKVTVKGTFPPAKFNNIFHAQAVNAGGLTADLQSLASQIATTYHSAFAALMSNGLTITEVDVQDISSNFGLSGTQTVSFAGSNVSAPLYANLAWVISWKISRRYRGGHPRSYMCGLTQGSAQDSQTFTTAFQTQANTAAATYLTNFNLLTSPSTGLIQMVQVSYFQGHDANHKPILRPVPVVDVINTAHVDLRVDTQRRRAGKGRG